MKDSRKERRNNMTKIRRVIRRAAAGPIEKMGQHGLAGYAAQTHIQRALMGSGLLLFPSTAYYVQHFKPYPNGRYQFEGVHGCTVPCKEAKRVHCFKLFEKDGTVILEEQPMHVMGMGDCRSVNPANFRRKWLNHEVYMPSLLHNSWQSLWFLL
jgi:hypothetical protein